MIQFISSLICTLLISMYLIEKTNARDKLWNAVEKKVPSKYHSSLFMVIFLSYAVLACMTIGIENNATGEIVKGIVMGIGVGFTPIRRSNNLGDGKSI